MMVVYRVVPTWAVLTLPLFLLLAGAIALAVGLWLAGLAVKYHDVAIAVGFGITIWQYLTPVAYSASLVPEQWRWLYQLNPLYAVIEGFRWALLGTAAPPTWALVVSTLLVAVMLVTGAFYFRRTERTIVMCYNVRCRHSRPKPDQALPHRRQGACAAYPGPDRPEPGDRAVRLPAPHEPAAD
jgi:lipopolysaccharide transport system permease protein